jgi:hypothetical protein
MDHSQAPVLDALAAYHRRDEVRSRRLAKAGRSPDPRVLAVLGEDVFRRDVLGSGAAGAGLSAQRRPAGMVIPTQLIPPLAAFVS